MRLPRLAVAMTAVALACAVVPAHSIAIGTDVYACQFTGSAALAPGARALVSTATAALSGSLPPDNGLFAFTTAGAPLPTVCSGVRVSSTPPYEVQATGLGSINANGVYTNLVCATGTVNGVMTLTAGIPGPPSPVTAGFVVAFAGGAGEIMITGASNSEGAGGAGTGYAQIVPDATSGGGDCVLNNVTRFRVVGAFTVIVPVL